MQTEKFNVYRICKVEECNGSHYAQGFCEGHYYRWRRGKSLKGTIKHKGKIRKCSLARCKNMHFARNYCRLHYTRWKRHGDPFKVLRIMQHIVAVKLPSLKDIYWIAGFLEDEGCFFAKASHCLVRADQVERQPLNRLRELLGGSIYENKNRNYRTWSICGARARGLMMTIANLMSPRRFQQIKKALKNCRNQRQVGLVDLRIPGA